MSNGHVRAIVEALSSFKIGGGLLGTFAFKDLLEELKSTKTSCLMCQRFISVHLLRLC